MCKYYIKTFFYIKGMDKIDGKMVRCKIRYVRYVFTQFYPFLKKETSLPEKDAI